jgi:Ribosomal proteins 50S-L15, 50S-L18e, 60S-L27A
LSRLNELEGDTFSADSLVEARVIRKLKAGLKILGDGEISRAVTVEAHKFTASAKQKIEAAGGKVVWIGGEPQAEEAPAPKAKAKAAAPAAQGEAPKKAPKKKAKKGKVEGEE